MTTKLNQPAQMCLIFNDEHYFDSYPLNNTDFTNTFTFTNEYDNNKINNSFNDIYKSDPLQSNAYDLVSYDLDLCDDQIIDYEFQLDLDTCSLPVSQFSPSTCLTLSPESSSLSSTSSSPSSPSSASSSLSPSSCDDDIFGDIPIDDLIHNMNEFLNKNDLSHLDSTTIIDIDSNEEAFLMNLETDSSLKTSETFIKCCDNSVGLVESTIQDYLEDDSSKDSTNNIKRIKDPNNLKAARKYRLKKETEKKKLFLDVEYFKQKNDSMKSEISELRSEIDVYKKLLVQAYIAKTKALELNNSL
jgi:hypothetical protein